MVRKRTSIYIASGALLFFGLNLIPLLVHSNAYYTPDSVGYYGIAATICGFDWEDTLATVNTYSYGYALLLVPVIALFHGTAYILVASAVVNSMLLGGIFVCSFLFINKFLKSDKNSFFATVALTAYSGYLSAAQNYISDVLTIFLFEVLIVLWVSLLDSPKYYKDCFLAVVSAYMYATHQRTIIIPIILVISYIIMCRKKVLGYKHLWVYLLIMSALFFIARCGYSITTPLFASKLEFNANDEKVRFMWFINEIFSLETIIRIFRNLLGQFYYLYIGTIGLFPIGMCVCIDMCIDMLKGKSLRDKKQTALMAGVSLVLVLTFVFQEGVVCVSLNPTRTYHLVMGRYIEYMVVPVVSFLLIFIYKYKDELKKRTKIKVMRVTLFQLIGIFFALLGGISVTFWEKDLGNADGKWAGISSIGVSWLGDHDIPWLLGLRICILLSLGIMWLLLDGRTTRTLAVYAVVLNYFLCNTAYTYINDEYPSWQNEESDISDITDFSHQYGIETFYWPANAHTLLMQQLQVRMPGICFIRYNVSGGGTTVSENEMNSYYAIVEDMPESCMVAVPNAIYDEEDVKGDILRFSVFGEFTLLVNVGE